MSQMKRLLENLEPVPQGSLMWELLHHSCPTDEYEGLILDGIVKTFRISLHCHNFVVECLYNPKTSDYAIINYEKEWN